MKLTRPSKSEADRIAEGRYQYLDHAAQLIERAKAEPEHRADLSAAAHGLLALAFQCGVTRDEIMARLGITEADLAEGDG